MNWPIALDRPRDLEAALASPPRENVLTLRGKTEIAASEGARSVWGGLTGQQFRETVQLPGDVDAERASAEYHDGILTQTLPKAEHARVRTIKVNGGRTQPIEGEQR